MEVKLIGESKFPLSVCVNVWRIVQGEARFHPLSAGIGASPQ